MRESLVLQVRRTGARWHQVLGWPGWFGIGLLAASTFLLAEAASKRATEAISSDISKPVLSPVVEPEAAFGPLPLALPLRSALSPVLAAVQRAAVDSELGWPGADYRVVAATETDPARLEIRCQLKGPYPKARSMVSALLRDVDGLTLREFSASRPRSDVADVDVKLVLVVYLRGQTAPRGAS